MKITRNILLAACLWFGPEALAQNHYWVIESNKWVKDITIVRIYDAHHRQIAERTVPRTMDINNPQDVWILNRTVRTVVREQRQAAGKPRRNSKLSAHKTKA